VGGGVGIAAIYPIARALRRENQITSIIGARTAGLLIYEKEIAIVSDELLIATDDGSRGHRGFVTDVLHRLLQGGKPVARVMAVGPAAMMKAVAEVTRPWRVKTIVSLNSLMVDGTGMCGACRVEVGGQTRFTCVDGPEFDAHQVNFDLLIKRLDMYKKKEELAVKRFERERSEKT
jgi:NAD(P)H-flavin reductase